MKYRLTMTVLLSTLALSAFADKAVCYKTLKNCPQLTIPKTFTKSPWKNRTIQAKGMMLRLYKAPNKLMAAMDVTPMQPKDGYGSIQQFIDVSKKSLKNLKECPKSSMNIVSKDKDSLVYTTTIAGCKRSAQNHFVVGKAIIKRNSFHRIAYSQRGMMSGAAKRKMLKTIGSASVTINK